MERKLGSHLDEWQIEMQQIRAYSITRKCNEGEKHVLEKKNLLNDEAAPAERSMDSRESDYALMARRRMDSPFCCRIENKYLYCSINRVISSLGESY